MFQTGLGYWYRAVYGLWGFLRYVSLVLGGVANQQDILSDVLHLRAESFAPLKVLTSSRVRCFLIPGWITLRPF
jgi:hypothetical protein